MVEIITRRLLLRDFTSVDCEAFVAYRTDPAQARSLLDLFAAWRQARPRSNFQLALCHSSDEALVGCCGLRGDGAPQGIAEFGLELAPSWRGRYRYALEAAEAMLAFGFETLGLAEVFGLTAADNERVHRLARWYGATLTHKEDGAIEWRLSREAWYAGRASGRSARRPRD